MKKTAIITFHATHAYDTVLQVYDLQQTILRFGFQCDIIDILTKQEKNNLNFTTINFEKIIKYNPYFSTSLTANPKREEFFKRYQKESLNNLIKQFFW